MLVRFKMTEVLKYLVEMEREVDGIEGYRTCDGVNDISMKLECAYETSFLNSPTVCVTYTRYKKI